MTDIPTAVRTYIDDETPTLIVITTGPKGPRWKVLDLSGGEPLTTEAVLAACEAFLGDVPHSTARLLGAEIHT